MINHKSIIIVGASGGIGSVVARAIVEAGGNATLFARTESRLLALQDKLGKEHTLVVAGDATDAADIERAFAETKARFGNINAVVIAAGTWKQLSIDAPLTEAIDLAKKHFEMLFLGSFTVGYAAQKFFREQGSGLIANISSHAAIRPELNGNLTYGPMKAASRHFMFALHHELAGTNVRVTDIAPAIVNTPDAAGLLDTEEKRAAAVQPEDIAAWIIEHLDDPHIPETKHFDSTLVL